VVLFSVFPSICGRRPPTAVQDLGSHRLFLGSYIGNSARHLPQKATSTSRDPVYLEQLHRLLELSHTPQVSIYFEILYEELQSITLHSSLLREVPEALSSSDPQTSRVPRVPHEPTDISTSQISSRPPMPAIYTIASYTKVLINVAFAKLFVTIQAAWNFVGDIGL